MALDAVERVAHAEEVGTEPTVELIDPRSEVWPRRRQFDTFRRFQFPHFNLCADIDVTLLRSTAPGQGVSFTAAFVYLVARTANDIPEFRQRIRGDTIVEHSTVHPSTTILLEDDTFTFCTVPYDPELPAFALEFEERVKDVRRSPTVQATSDRDDLIYMTAIPWVSFTSFSHPMPSLDPDSIPRFAWGKFRADGQRIRMPFSVQGHHALMDGLHVGRYYTALQDYLDHPGTFVRGDG